MAAFLILLVILLLVAGGVVANLYLYSRGAFAQHKQESGPAGSKEPDPKAEQRYYAHVGALGESTEEYARRVVSTALVAVVFLIVILALFWQSLLH